MPNAYYFIGNIKSFTFTLRKLTIVDENGENGCRYQVKVVFIQEN